MFRIALTGHRPDKLGGYDRNNPLRTAIRERFTDILLCLIAERWPVQVEVYCGMALGFDQDAACACIRAEVPFVACVPFEGQESRWPAQSQEEYREFKRWHV